ncbi:MAG: hypothetical protein JNK85_11820 [Verrucomicrobiales bacterium]|nr:hypothetical protein [Verrucomicrobiales bacterium]
MAKLKRIDHHSRTAASSAPRRAVLIAAVLALAAVVVGWRLLTPTPPTSDAAAIGNPPTPFSGSTSTHPAQMSNSSPAANTQGPALQKAVGRWQRTDGSYIIEILAVDASTGRLEARYLNPQPIHVGRAEAKHENGKLTVFVELQDVNYPGSTYRLTHFPTTDQLFGTYYQAALDQSFDVEFSRIR